MEKMKNIIFGKLVNKIEEREKAFGKESLHNVKSGLNLKHEEQKSKDESAR